MDISDYNYYGVVCVCVICVSVCVCECIRLSMSKMTHGVSCRSFLFTIVNSAKSSSTKYVISKSSYAINNHPG